MYWNRPMETIDRESLERIQLERLQKTVHRMYTNVAFYRERMQKQGVKPEDIRTLADLKLLPFMDKRDLRDNYPDGTFAAPRSEIVRIHASSGTTGKPIVAGYTQGDIEMWAECVARCLGCAGVTKNGARTVTHTGCGSDPSRQEAPHPHQALLSPDGRYVLVCDLGLDRVFVYDRELTLVSQADAPKGQGIRHLVFAPDGKQVYAVNELGCSVTEFRWSDGELTALRTTPFPCAGKSYAGAVRLSENGDLLFISLRGDDTIAVYAREEKGLRLLRSFPCGGCWPRDFAVCGDRLLVANERSGNVCTMDFYGEIKSEISVPAPLCVMV